MTSPCRKVLWGVAIMTLVSGCVSAPELDRPVVDPLLQQISATTTGDFATSLSETDPTLILTVIPEPLLTNDLVLDLHQRSATGAARHFRVLLRSEVDSVGNPLTGWLAPLDASGAMIAQCPLEVRTGSDGLSLATDAASCRFGLGENEIGLAKEFLFAGDQIRVADRLLRPDQNSADAETVSELRFYRLAQYEGWVGVLEDSEWRIARNVRIDTANGSVEPLDAAGMSLGVIIQMDRADLGDGNQPIVRLSILDAEQQQTLGRAWSEPGASRIGMATHRVQIGLERVR